MVRRWLKGLRYCVSHLTKECDALVAATLVSTYTALVYMCVLEHSASHYMCYLYGFKVIPQLRGMQPEEYIVLVAVHSSAMLYLHN